MTSDYVLVTDGLCRKFGDVEAVASIDLRVPRGSFFGFLGPNGAGKSTTMKCLTGLLRPTRGSIRILGFDPQRDPVELKRQIGVMPEDLALFDRLTAVETMEFVGRVHGLTAAEIRSRTDELLRLLGLDRTGNALATEFSHGMRKKLSLAIVLLPNPKMLFLDEPFEGIDAVASRQIKEILQSFVKRGGTVFLTSHILEVVERLCDHIAVIDHGRILVQGPMEELRAGDREGHTLEDIFLELVGSDSVVQSSLEWLQA